MTHVLFLLLFSYQVAAGPAAAPAPANGRPAQAVFDGLRALMPMMCVPASTLRVCYSVLKEVCESRVNSAFENCLRDQKIKFAGMPVMDPKSAGVAENNLKTCVLESYANQSITSYRKTPDCEKWVPKVKKTAAKSDKPVDRKAGATAFEDPLEGQRDMVGRYKLRLLHDVRMVDNLKAEMDARKTCINDKARRESNLSCFKRVLKEFEITSSPQIVHLAVLATGLAIKDRAEGFSPSNGNLIDMVLAVAERVQLENFHLAVLQATNDKDRVILNQLRVDDQKLMKTQADHLAQVLSEKFAEKPKGREPANMTEIKMRLDSLKGRRWVYPKPASF